MKEQDQNRPQPPAEGGQGRQEQDEAANTAMQPQADISQVDQQEGQMDNGELGGNFSDDSGHDQKGG